MSKNLVINPCLQIHQPPGTVDEYLVMSPVPGKGIQRLKIANASLPSAYAFIDEYTKSGLNLLDLDSDLDKETRSLFEDSKVLIEKSKAPVMPLFACQLDDIPPFEGDVDDELVVNGTLRLEQFDFTKLNLWMYELHLLPTQPVAWIANPATGVETGFWLRPEQADIVAKLESGDVQEVGKPGDETVRRLYSAGIVGTAESFKEEKKIWSKKIRNSRSEFEAFGYTVLRNLLPKFHLNALRKFYRDYIAQGFMDFGDNQVDRRYWQINEPFARTLHRNLAHIMKTMADEEVIDSYCFAASYVEGAELKPHIDRSQCEFSVSFQVDFSPEQENGESPWPLSLFRPVRFDEETFLFGWDAIEKNRPEVDPVEIYLKNGDGLFYRGRELVHFRQPLDAGCTSTSIFLHYVRPDFDGELM